MNHKFVVGQLVTFTASNVSRRAATGSFEVIRHLPSDGGERQYRIRNTAEAFERVARESQLDVC